MDGAERPAPQRARGHRVDQLVPGNWDANPLTCQILRNAGFAIDGHSDRRGSVPPDGSVPERLARDCPDRAGM